jgi:FkbM family methyltransferase
MGQGSLAHKIYGGVQLIRACKDWPLWFKVYASGAVANQQVCYRMRGGARLLTRRDGSDLHIIDEIWAFRKYDYFGCRVRPGDVVVDIGANIGIFTVYAAYACKAARVISFEPFPENFALLKQNVEANGLDSVVCVNQAVAGRRGLARLHLNPHEQGSHSMIPSEGGAAIDVDCCTLDDAVDRYSLSQIDYLKVDCEGAEYEVLLNTSPTLLRRIGRISMEYHDHPVYNIQGLARHLEDHGFQVKLYQGHRLYAQRPTTQAAPGAVSRDQQGN